MEIKSDRLRLTPYNREHIEHLFPLIRDNWELTRYMCWDPPSDIRETYANFDAKPDKDRSTDFVIFYNHDLIGRITVRDFIYSADTKKLEQVNFGYWIAQPFQNQGFGTEIVERIKKFCLEDLQAQKITGECFAQNTASIRVFEKTGFTYLKTKKNTIEKNGGLFDEMCFEQILR